MFRAMIQDQENMPAEAEIGDKRELLKVAGRANLQASIVDTSKIQDMIPNIQYSATHMLTLIASPRD